MTIDNTLGAATGELVVAPASAQQHRHAAARKAARRNSRRVSFLRIVVPGIGALLLIFVIASITARQLLGQLPFGLASLSLTTEGFVMDAPALTSSDASGRTYSVSADQAVQSLTDPGQIKLENIVASLVLSDGTQAEFTAPNGDYHMSTEHLRLSGGLLIVTGRGDKAELESVEVDFKSGAALAPSSVRIESDMGSINADTLSVQDNGNVIRFEGNVRMVIRPDRVEMLR